MGRRWVGGGCRTFVVNPKISSVGQSSIVRVYVCCCYGGGVGFCRAEVEGGGVVCGFCFTFPFTFSFIQFSD